LVGSAVCHPHAEKVTPTNGLQPNNSRAQGEMNNAIFFIEVLSSHAVAHRVMNARTNSLGGM
jgi:hypothetical protein